MLDKYFLFFVFTNFDSNLQKYSKSSKTHTTKYDCYLYFPKKSLNLRSKNCSKSVSSKYSEIIQSKKSKLKKKKNVFLVKILFCSQNLIISKLFTDL